MKAKLKKGDLVKVVAGAHAGQTGPIIWIKKDKSRVSVEGVNVTKHVKPSNANPEGGIKQAPATINISNVMLLDPKKKNSTTRVGYQIAKDGTKQRVAKKSQAVIK